MVGTHRRLYVRDVLALKMQRDGKRRRMRMRMLDDLMVIRSRAKGAREWRKVTGACPYAGLFRRDPGVAEHPGCGPR